MIIITAASAVFGQFTLSGTKYRNEFASISSPESRNVVDNLGYEMEAELYGFGLHGMLEVSISSLMNK